jgi:Protein of unknown function (DUF2846)
MGFRLSSVVALAVALLLSGCVTERAGLDFAAMSRGVGAPKTGRALIVVFREKGYAGLADEGWEVKLDGELLRGLKTGTYVYADRPAGRHQLTSTAPLFPGETQLDITVAAGRTYFFLAKPSDRAQKLYAMSLAGGLTGLVVGAAMTSGASNPGPLDFFPLEESAVRAALSDLKLAE